MGMVPSTILTYPCAAPTYPCPVPCVFTVPVVLSKPYLKKVAIRALLLKFDNISIYIMWHIVLYMNLCFANSPMAVPMWALTLRHFVYGLIYSSKPFIIRWILSYINPCCVSSHLFVPLRALTLWTSLHTYICSHVYTNRIIDTFVSTFKFQLRNGEDLGYSTDCQPGFFCTNRRGCAPHFVFGIIL